MKLLSQKSREYKGKPYYKYWIIIPNKFVEMLGWTKGNSVAIELKGKKLIIEKA